MTSNKEELTPYIQAKTIFDTWIFTHCILNAISKNRIPAHIFQSPLKISDESGRGVTVDYKQKVGNISVIADNLRLVLTGTYFITLNEALDRIFGEKPGCSENTAIDSLRAIIYMFRCAFAHTPTRPIWVINKEKYKKIFRINEIDFEIDFRTLNGRELEASHYDGWYGLMRIMRYCLKIIAAHQNKDERINQD